MAPATVTPLSQNQNLLLAASIVALIPLGFGINAILRPDHALSFFEFTAPLHPVDKKLVHSLMVVYGARDIFMAIATFVAAQYGHRQALGWILIATAGVAFADGAVCYDHGKGQWNHWGYAPVLAGFGSVLLGAFDKVVEDAEKKK